MNKKNNVKENKRKDMLEDIIKQEELDIQLMGKALEEAKKAYKVSEIPIGAIIVKDGKIIGRGYNLKENNNNSILHAEIIAIEEACKNLNNWRLEDTTIYVNLEPCIMCAGAIVNSRIKRIVFGCYDEKSGAFGSKININDLNLNHKVEISANVLEEESREIIQKFFKELRDGKQKKF